MASTNIFISQWILWIFFTSSALGRKNISTKSEMFDLKLIHRHNTSCCCFFDTFPAFTHHQKDSGVSEQYFALISMQFETFQIETITIHFGSLCFIERKKPVAGLSNWLFALEMLKYRILIQLWFYYCIFLLEYIQLAKWSMLQAV